MGQSSHPHWEDDMVHNYAHGLSMFDHLILLTTKFRKVGPFEHVKSVTSNVVGVVCYK